VAVADKDSYGNKTGHVTNFWKAELAIVDTSEENVRLFEDVWDKCIESWKAEDREARYAGIKREQRRIHDGTFGKVGSRFDPVARDVYYQNRSGYEWIGYGISVESMQRIAVIRVPSTSVRLHVNVAIAFQGVNVSRNKRRKMARYQANPPPLVWERIDKLCAQATRDYWAISGTR
jgi:hypothetical protein